MNTAVKGRAAEHEFRKYAEQLGWWCIRSAASKGEADLVVLPRRRARDIVYGDCPWVGTPGVPVLCDIKINRWAGTSDKAELETVAKATSTYALLVNRNPGRLLGLAPRWRFKWVVQPLRIPYPLGANGGR